MTRIPKELVAAALASFPICVSGQTCSPSATSHEADLFGIRSLSLTMSRGTAIPLDATGTIRAGVEAVWLPRINDETARATTCRPGKGPENVNALPAVARARVAIALPGHTSLEASWLPPVRLKGMRGSIIGLALGYAWRYSTSVTLAGRVHATLGHVDGPFTCPESALRDATSECHGGTLSNDRLEPNVLGGDVTAGWTPAGSRLSWFAGGGYSRLTPRFQVLFRNQSGFLDTTRVRVDLNRLALFAGASRELTPRWRASGEVYATTRDGVTGRIVFDGVLRHGH